MKITINHLIEAKELISIIKKDKSSALSRIQQNIVKSLGYSIENIKGDWNGYGYAILGKEIVYNEINTFENLIKRLRQFMKSKVEIKAKPKLTYEEQKQKWIRRFVKLTRISEEEAKVIANEKEDYKQNRIDEVEARQYEHHSKQRATLIRKMERENPLRYIKNEEHAQAILAASNRHNYTNYDGFLDEGREKAALGEIEKDSVKEYARKNLRHYN